MRDKSKNIQQLTLKELRERAGEVRSGQTNEEREKQEGGGANICDSSSHRAEVCS